MSSKGFYRYLGVFINLNLDWSKQIEESTETYKKVVKAICYKRYLQIHNIIRLINTVAQTTLSYRMNFFLFPKLTMESLNKWTTKQLKKLTHIPSNSDDDFWFQIRNLRDLTVLNLSTYINASVARILNNPNNLAHDLEIQQSKTSTDHTILERNHDLKLVNQGGNVNIPSCLNSFAWSLFFVDHQHPIKQKIHPSDFTLSDFSRTKNTVEKT